MADDGLRIVNSVDNSQVYSSFTRMRSEIVSSAETARKESDKIDASFKKIGAAAAGVFAVSQLKDFAMQVANVRGEFQQLEMAFTTMLGSADKANTLMEQLTKTAAVTPFDIKGVTDGAKQLLAYGVAADEVNDTLVHLGDIAAGLSLPLGDLVYLYGTTLTQGRMFTQDLRQFMGRGIPIAEELAKQFGVTKDKVQELVSTGKVGADEFKKAIMAMSSEGGKFGGLMEAQSKTITGQISNIEDAIEQMFNEIGKKSDGIISNTLGFVSSVVDNWEKIGKVLLVVISSYGAYKAAVLAVAAAHKIAALWGEVQAFISLAKSITSAKDAMLLLNMATNANPIGLIVGVVASATAAFTLFNSEAKQAAPLVEKFGESAATTITKVNTLSTTLRGLTEGTSTHKKAVDELNDILTEYGVSQIKEGDNIDVINKKREQAIELIKLEAIERQRANNLEAGREQYEQAVKDAKEQLFKDLQEAQTSILNLGLMDIIGDNKELQDNALIITNIIGDAVQSNISLIAGKTGEEYQEGLKKMYSIIQQRMRDIGVSEETIAKEWADNGLFNHSNMIEKFISSMQYADGEITNYTDKTNKAADAERDAAEGAMSFSDKVKATQRRLSGASDDVHTLYKKIKTLMSQYSENTIGFTIKFNGDVPAWMSKMDIPKLTSLAKKFTSIGESMGKGQTVKVNGVAYTKQQALQRGAAYAQAADDKQTAADKAKRDADDKKKDRERRAKDAKSKADSEREERERKASEQKRLEDLEEEIALQRIRKEEDLANRLTDVRLEAEGNSAQILAKKREQDNKEEILAIERERDDAMKAYVDGERKIFEQKEAIKKAQNPNYTKKNFDESSVDTSDIKKQYDDIIAYTKKIQAQDIAKEQSDALNTYLAEYGTFEQRKLAITEQYEEKIKAAVTEGEKLTLEEQLRSALSAVDTDALKRNIDWADIFGDMGGMLYDEMRDNLKKLEEYMQSSEFLKLGATDQKNIADVASQLRSKVGGGTADFSKLGAQANALQKVMQELNEAEQREKDAVLLVKEKQEAYNKALADGKQDLTSYETELNEAKQSLNECSAEVKNLSSQAEQSARSLHDNLGKVVTGLNNLSSGLQGLKSGSLQGAFEGLKTTCSSLSTLINGKVGQALGAFAGKLGGVIGQIVESALGLLDILKDGISSIITSLLDTVFNAVNGILHDVLSGEIVTNVIGSITNGITNIFDTLSFGASSNWMGGNKEDNEKEIAKLSQSNDMLRQSIDGLAETIKSSDTTNSQSVEAYKKAIAAQEEWEQNQRNAINLRASEYSNSGHGFLGLGGKSSFNHYVDEKGSSWYGWQDFTNALRQNGVNKIVGSAGDIWNLSPEGMKLLRDFAPTAWMDLLDTHGENNPTDLINAYIEQAGVGDQLISQLNEKLTGYSWDGFKNSFVSALEDMDSTTEDFANNIQKVISNAILNSLITSKYQERIKSLYKKISEAAENDDISKEEAEAIRKENEAIANAMLADREMLKNMGVLQDETKYNQDSGSTRGFQSMSQDTGDELNGRFTAIQIAAYDLKNLAIARNEMLYRLEHSQGSMKTSVEGITDALAITNIHLSDISKYTKHLIAMEESLDDIKNHIKNL